jgi:hypothetical protein
LFELAHFELRVCGEDGRDRRFVRLRCLDCRCGVASASGSRSAVHDTLEFASGAARDRVEASDKKPARVLRARREETRVVLDAGA